MNWDVLRSHARPPVMDASTRAVVTTGHITVTSVCDPDTCTCGGIRTVWCTCGERHTEPEPRRVVGRVPHALTHAPWRVPRPRQALTTAGAQL